jgi:stearoyl-CoA desaturase (delta-9 desaturase)
MIQGLLAPSPWGLVGATLLLTHVTIVAVTVYLHRHQAHRAIDLHPAMAHFFRFWLWLTTGMKTRDWVAIHRKHHARCETPDDPHSPQVLGLRRVLWQGAELYRAEAGRAETLERYGKGTPDDWLERNLYSRSYLGITLMALLDLLLFGVIGGAVWAAQMVWIPFWAAGVINGVGHFWGYRNFESPDAATNISPLGLLIGGEELHNNHHAFASSAKFSNKWWEFDLGWGYIRLLQGLGLARVRKVAPVPVIDEERPVLDIESVKALTVNRMYLMADYGRRVLRPVFLAETRRLGRGWRRMLRRARRYALRDRALLGEAERSRLNTVLDQSTTLATVYQYKLRLKAVWERHASSHEARLQALREWCAEAEASGIEALQEFTHLLRRYALSPA